MVYWVVMGFFNTKKYGGEITDNLKKLNKMGQQDDSEGNCHTSKPNVLCLVHRTHSRKKEATPKAVL